MSKLKEKRMETGMSQSQLAEKAKINIRILQYYEQRTKNFDHARIDRILKICLALNCRIDEVIENPEFIKLYKKYIKQMKG